MAAPLRSLRAVGQVLGTAALLLLFGVSSAGAQVPAPKSVIGFEPGADYKLADYDQVRDYYRQLSEASNRVQMKTIGTTSMGRPMTLLFMSSADNLGTLDRWQDISSTLARARVAEERAQQLAEEGKAVVWIDAGMHATERAPGQAMLTLAHRVATEESAEMQKIRQNVVLLLMPMMNPDGLDIVENWYDRVLDTPYETSSPPWLYQKYVGHDNNRDWFMNNMPETRAVTDVIYNEWYPQIVVNHHQTSPSWARIFVPPFTGPVNPDIHPGVVAGVNQVGTAMTQRFAMQDMPGVVSNDIFTMFWNGGDAHGALLSQPDRHPYGGGPRHAHAAPLRARFTTPARRRAQPDGRHGALLHGSVERGRVALRGRRPLHEHGVDGRARPRGRSASAVPLQHVRDGARRN